MNRRTRPDLRILLIFCFLSAGAGCSVEAEDELAADLSLDTAVLDLELALDSAGLAVDPAVPAAAPEEPVVAPDPEPAPILVERGESAPPARRRADTVRVVQGTVEVELGAGRYSPAAHVLVVLENQLHRQETLVGRDGDFYFEEVPAGQYTLQVMSLRGKRVVSRTRITVATGDAVSLPHIRIPRDSAAALPRAPR